MGRFGITILLVVLGLPAGDACAQSIRYPRVYGATGRPYGPTQAHYQYQKQYGRPWHGYGGITASVRSGVGYNSFNGFSVGQLPYGYGAYQNFGISGYGYGGYVGINTGVGFNPYFGYTQPVPPVIYGYPPVLGGNNPFDNSVLNNARLENDLLRNQPLDFTPVPGGRNLPLATTPEAKLKSIRAEAQGDMWFQQQEYHKAIDRYKVAVAEAPDRGEAQLRLAVCYAALGHMDLASRQLQRGLVADPNMAIEAKPLKEIYGPGNAIAQSAMVHRATLWAKEDIRDPERLFLLGTLLYLQDDPRASVPLETGMMLDGGGEHFRSVLAAARNSAAQTNSRANVDGPVNPRVIDQTPHPQTQPPANNNPTLPPLPAPPAEQTSPINPSPPGPVLPSPNR